MKRNFRPAPSTLLTVLLLGLPAVPAIAQAPASSCKMALGQGHHEVRRAQNKKAIALFREALSDPACAGEAQLGLATAYNADNDHKKAIQAAEAALRMVEDAEVQAEAHYQVGLALDRRGARMTDKKEQAVKAFEQALELSEGEHRGAVRALLRIFKETHDEERQAALEARFPGVRVATRAEQRRALKPKKKAPEEPTAVAEGPPGELPEWERVGDGEIYDCETREQLTQEDFEARLAKYADGGPREWGEEISRPEKVDFQVPQYTDEDRKRRVNGIVIVQAIIEVDGTIPLVRIVRGLTEGLNAESVKAICRARFKPARDASGEPVAVFYNLTNNFSTTGRSVRENRGGDRRAARSREFVRDQEPPKLEEEEGLDCKTLQRLTLEEFEERATELGAEKRWHVKPRKTSAPQPQYTEEARRLHVEGILYAEVVIDTDGTVPLVKIVRGLPGGLNGESAMAFCKHQFEPARDELDELMPVYYLLYSNFRLP